MKPTSSIAQTVCWLCGALILPVQAAPGADPPPAAASVQRLAPQLRSSSLDAMAVAPLSIPAVAHFLRQVRILGPGEIAGAGRVLAAGDGRLLLGAGDTVTATLPRPSSRLEIWRSGGTARPPAAGQPVSGLAIRVAEAELVRSGSPATLRLLKSEQEVQPGDLVLPAAPVPDLPPPRSPERPVEARILSVLGGLGTAGNHAVVLLDQGSAAGLAPGHVLKLLPARSTAAGEEIGLLYVFRSFDRSAVALILEARQPVVLLDMAVSP